METNSQLAGSGCRACSKSGTEPTSPVASAMSPMMRRMVSTGRIILDARVKLLSVEVVAVHEACAGGGNICGPTAPKAIHIKITMTERSSEGPPPYVGAISGC